MSQQGTWLYSQATGEYYYWSQNERCYVFQSGRRIFPQQAPQQPIAVPVPRSSALYEFAPVVFFLPMLKRETRPPAQPPSTPLATSPNSSETPSPAYTYGSRPRRDSHVSSGTLARAQQPIVSSRPQARRDSQTSQSAPYYQWTAPGQQPRVATPAYGTNAQPQHAGSSAAARPPGSPAGMDPIRRDFLPLAGSRYRRNIAPTTGEYERLDPREIIQSLAASNLVLLSYRV